MKYLIVVLVAVIIGWIALRNRERRPPPRRPGAGAARAQTIVACSHCGVHVPLADAVQGPAGPFCSEAHRLAHAKQERAR